MGFKDAQVPDFCRFISEPGDVFRVELWVYLSSLMIVGAPCGGVFIRKSCGHGNQDMVRTGGFHFEVTGSKHSATEDPLYRGADGR
ncbi:hypothetical protein TNCV_3072851 [Trichonephila clavipes]|nr:hypothetical protein TNCV_3072851 [Trichonephila clavipes]